MMQRLAPNAIMKYAARFILCKKTSLYVFLLFWRFTADHRADFIDKCAGQSHVTIR